MRTPHLFANFGPIIDLIVEDTGLHPDVVRTVLQSQTDILQEEVFLKGHIVSLCGLGTVAVYDYGDCRRNQRYRIKFHKSVRTTQVIRQFNNGHLPEGVEYKQVRFLKMTEEERRRAADAPYTKTPPKTVLPPLAEKS